MKGLLWLKRNGAPIRQYDTGTDFRLRHNLLRMWRVRNNTVLVKSIRLNLSCQIRGLLYRICVFSTSLINYIRSFLVPFCIPLPIILPTFFSHLKIRPFSWKTVTLWVDTKSEVVKSFLRTYSVLWYNPTKDFTYTNHIEPVYDQCKKSVSQ